MKQLTADVLFCASCLVTLALHVISLNFAPWMDEVHIVEMGRLAFGAHTESILTNADGSFFIPLYYLGPCIHELAFRLAGPSGVRALPMLMLVLAATLFRKWLRGNNLFRESTTLILSLCLLWMPLFIQSTRLVRIDSAIMAATFGILVLIDTPAAVGNRVRLSAAAVLAAVSPFLWPSAILLFPLYAERHISRSIEARRPTSALLADGLIGALSCVATVCCCLLPILAHLSTTIAAFSTYFSSVGKATAFSQGCNVSIPDTLRSLAVLLVKETLRAPFFYLALPVGAVLSLRRHKLFFCAFFIAFVVALASGLHTFRNTFLFPYLIVFFCLAVHKAENLLPRLTTTFLCAFGLYGLLTGPIAYAIAGTSAASNRNPLSSAMKATINMKSPKVLSLDYRTYYAGRTLGWRQSAYPDPATTVTDPANLLASATFVILPELDRYRAIEESYTLYGLLRNLSLARAKKEQHVTQPSFLARIGEAFAYDELPSAARAKIVDRLQKNGFSMSAETSEIWERQVETHQ